MLCPICKQHQFTTLPLAENLDAEQCTTCRGLFISSARFFNFRTASTIAPPPPAHFTNSSNATTPAALHLCPTCSRFMRRYDVGHGLGFAIDKCATCGGFWLGQNEWQSLREKNLYLHLNLIASEDWQNEIDRQQRIAAERARLIHHLGENDFTKLQNVTDWIINHAYRDQLLAYLHQHLAKSEPPANL